MAALQVLLGFLLPTMLLARIEHHGFVEHNAKEQQRQHQERLQQEQQWQWRQRFVQQRSGEQGQSGSQWGQQANGEEESYEGINGSVEPHRAGARSKVTAVDRLYAALLTGIPCTAALPGCVCVGLLAAATWVAVCLAVN